MIMIITSYEVIPQHSMVTVGKLPKEPPSGWIMPIRYGIKREEVKDMRRKRRIIDSALPLRRRGWIKL